MQSVVVGGHACAISVRLASQLITALICCAVAGACTAPEEEPPTEADDDDVSSAALGPASLAGRVVDLDGASVEGLSVSLCGVTCNIATTDDEGVFAFVDVPPGTKVIEPTIAHVEDGEDISAAVRRWTRFFDFVTLDEDADLELDQPFVLYPVEEASGPLTGPQSMQLDDDLSVSFDADVILDDGPLPAGAAGVWLGATAIAPEHWPVRGLDGWTIEAAWGLATWDLEAPDVFAVTATLAEPVAPQADVGFLVADYTYGFTNGRFWYEPATLGADGLTLTTPPDGGIDRATLWLAVSRNP